MAAVANISAQEPAPAPGQVGSSLTRGFSAFIISEPRFPETDVHNRKNKFHDLVNDHGLRPTLATFVRQVPKDADSPTVQLLKKQDELAVKHARSRLGTFSVFLTLTNEYRKDETRDAKKTELETFANGLGAKLLTVGLASATITPDGAAAPVVPPEVQAIGFGPEDDIVVLLYTDFRIRHRWVFRSEGPTADDLAAIEKAVADLLKN